MDMHASAEVTSSFGRFLIAHQSVVCLTFFLKRPGSSMQALILELSILYVCVRCDYASVLREDVASQSLIVFLFFFFGFAFFFLSFFFFVCVVKE